MGVRGAPAGVGAVTLFLVVACGADPDIASDDCPDCAIRLEHVATIGEGTGEGALDEQMQVAARDDRGRFIVTSHVEALPYLYDSAGTFLGRLGREGEGPGEFTRASAVHVAADSLYVLDRGQGRILVFDGDLTYVRTMTGPTHYYTAVPLAGGRFMTNSALPVGPPLTVYDANGGVVATVGDTVAGDSPTTYLHRPRALAPSSTGGAWTVKRFFRPVLREWNADGELLREFALDVDWYEPYEEVRQPGPEAPPNPVITGVREDEAGRIWITGYGADESWADGLGEAQSGEGGNEYHPINDMAQTWDAYVSVLDPDTGDVLHQRRFDRVFVGIGGDLVAEPRLDELGFQPVLVHRLTLAANP